MYIASLPFLKGLLSLITKWELFHSNFEQTTVYGQALSIAVLAAHFRTYSVSRVGFCHSLLGLLGGWGVMMIGCCSLGAVLGFCLAAVPSYSLLVSLTSVSVVEQSSIFSSCSWCSAGLADMVS